MKKIIKILFTCLVFLLAACGGTDTSQKESFDNTVVIQLMESEHYEILSTNPIAVKRSSNVAFKVNIANGRVFDSSEDGYFIESESIFRVENVQYSKTVSFLTRPIGDCQLTIVNELDDKSYTVTPNRFSFAKGETVTIESLSSNFMCYTIDDYYRNDNLNKGTKMPVSFENKYSFVIEKDMKIFLNYFEDENIKMEYDANGGKTIDGQDSFSVDYRCVKPQINPVTILGTYYLFRDGYTLESYNTQKDGTGTRVGIGSKVDITHAENNQIKLYAQWKKWNNASDFEYTVIDDEFVSITGFVGSKDSKEVVVPNVIDGKIVKEIGNNTFSELETESIVLNLDLKTVDENAINNCEKLQELHMFTNIESIKNNSINSNSLSKIYINSTVYTNNKADHDRDITTQLDQIRTMENDKVIFVGQSTLRCNHDFSPFKEKYPNKDFYVFGAQAGCNFAIPLDILSLYLNENDIVIVSILETTMRQSYVGSGTFTFLKYNFDLFSLLNYQEYKNIFFSSYEKFITTMTNNIDDYIYNPERNINIDDYGCYDWGPTTDDENNVDPTYVPTFEKYQKVEEIEYLKKILDESKVKSENRYITWSSYNENSVTDYGIFNGFEKFIKENIGEFNYFDSIEENIYPGEYFRKNDSIHLSSIGSAHRILRWLEQIPIN